MLNFYWWDENNSFRPKNTIISSDKPNKIGSVGRIFVNIDLGAFVFGVNLGQLYV